MLQAQLEEFPKHIPSIQSCKLLRNHLAQPPLVPGSPLVFCDLIQIITFSNEADLAAYPHDPYHMAHVRETTHLLERVCIIDYPTEDTPPIGEHSL